MKAKIGLLALLALVTLLLPAAVVAQEPPGIPLIFEGRVSIDGEPAPVGSTISAEIEGVEVAGPERITDAGRYGITIEPDDNVGKMVVFKVNGVVGGQHEYVDPWETPTVELNLSVEGAAPTPTPTPSPSPSPTPTPSPTPSPTPTPTPSDGGLSTMWLIIIIAAVVVVIVVILVVRRRRSYM